MTRGPVQAGGVDIHEVADGYVVYQAERDRVHYLNNTAALVLEFCTGDNSVDEIARILQAAFELPVPPDDEVEECLAALRDEGLVS